MKTYHRIHEILGALLLALGMNIGSATAQTNVLRISEVTFPAGKTATVPIELENQSDIVGAQFVITTPYELKAYTDENGNETGLVKLNPQRAANHAASVTRTYNGSSYKRYRVIIYSETNAAFSGSSGTLLTLQMDMPETLTNGQVLNVSFYENTDNYYVSDHGVTILSDRESNNVLSSSANGKITIEVIPRPDILPAEVKVTQTLARPGDQLDFTWNVTNQGDLATGAGWTEKLFLENENKSRVYVGTTAYEGTLEVGASVQRSFSLNLDEYPGISGACKPVVQLLPAANCGEIALDQDNNTAVGSAYSLNVRKFLKLTAYKNSIPEKNTNSGYACELRRTGDLSVTQTFAITTRDADGNTNRLKVNSDGSGTVRFDKNVSKLNFYVYPLNNEDINVDPRVAIIVNQDKNNGYDTVTDSVLIEDDDLIPLTLETDKGEYNEGDVMKVTATVPHHYYPGDIYVYLTIEQGKRFKLPQRIVIPDGETSAFVYVNVLQDQTPANDMNITITGTADRHVQGATVFTLKDDDTPAIALTLSPTTVSEGAGPSAILGTITRTGVTNNKITIKLSDDGQNDIYYSQTTLTMPAGTTTINFPLGVRDNAIVDGDRTVNIRAAVYITDCNCSAIGDKQASVELPITITDDDGQALSLSLSRSTILEGDETGATLTVTRNTTENSQPLTVSLESDATDIILPATVTIPAGQTKGTAVITAPSNSTEEGDRTISVIAKAADFSSGSAWLLISDRTLPDAIIESATLNLPAGSPAGTIAAGGSFSEAVVVKNIGAAALPAGTLVQVLQNGTAVSSMTTQQAIPQGQTLTLNAHLQASNVPGDYTLQAVVNPKNAVAELLYVNNSSEQQTLAVTSLYSFTIHSDKSAYKDEDVITLSGTVSATGSSSVGGIHVEPYVIFNGQRTALDCVTDEAGHFSVIYERPVSFRGHFIYGACNPGEGKTAEAGTFDVFGLERVYNNYIKHELFKDEPYEGTISLKNLSPLTLHNIQAAVSGDVANYDVEVASVALLKGDSIAVVNYRICGHAASTGSDWERIAITFTSDEGASLVVNTYNYTRLHTPKLVVSPTSINTTVTKGVVRNYPVYVTNSGMAETGRIRIDLPQSMTGFVSLATPADMPSLQPGDTAQVILRFNPGDYDVNVIQKGNIAINCEHGNGVAVYFNVKVVSESKGNLRVRVQDENTIYGNKDGQKPYVKDATVQLKDYNTGATIVSGKTPDESADGILFEDVPEGVYQLYVTADKHDSYRQNILINPGETTDHTAVISYQAISVSWDVVETEVEDEYEIVTSLSYETHVPVPVVRMTLPDTINFRKIDYGHSSLFNIVLRNDGLIAAEDCYVNMPSVKGFTFTPLIEAKDFKIPAQQSYTIPVRIVRNAKTVQYGGQPPTDTGDDSNDPGGDGPDGDDPGTPGGDDPGTPGGDDPGTPGGDDPGTPGGDDPGTPGGDDPDGGGDDGPGGYVPCGMDLSGGYSWQCSLFKKSAGMGAHTGTGVTECGGGGGGGTNWYGGGGIGGGVGNPGQLVLNGATSGGQLLDWSKINVPCPPDTCNIWDCVTAWIPYYDCVKAGVEVAQEKYEAAKNSGKSCAVGFVPVVSKMVPVVTCMSVAFDCLMSSLYHAPRLRNAPVLKAANNKIPELMQSYFNKIEPYVIHAQCYVDYAKECYGASEMVENITEELSLGIELVDQRLAELDEEGRLMTMDPLTEIPEAETDEVTDPYGILPLLPQKQAVFYDFDIRRYIQRCINTHKLLLGQTIDSDNYIDNSRIEQLREREDSCKMALVNMGFATWEELVQSANADYLEYAEGQSKNVCATVKLEIEQKLVLTRQAFRGTLTMENGTSTQLTDIDLAVVVTNMLGEQATSHEFQINFESIDGFEGNVTGPWTLPENSKGVATILFIPTKYAAPDTLTTYSFGGTLTWYDGTTTQSRSLYPVKLQVKPSPELDLTYFMQRDIYGDNPLTKDVIEPIVPAEFTVLLHNKGKGDATNVRMYTNQPQIVENEKGLMVDFAIVSSSLNGGEKAMALDKSIVTQFGDIKAGGSSYATWDLTSSLLGHFVDYDVSVSHVTSYGNPDLSLLDQVTIHELIHSVNVHFGDVHYRGWVCNDYEDGHAEPDHIYFSNGTDEALKTLSTSTTVTALGDFKWRISLKVPQREWFYVSIADPTGGIAKIVSITDETSSQSLDPQNFWKTQYTMQDGFDPLAENKLHIVDYADAPVTKSYVVEFEPMPEVRLEVASIDTIPDEKDIATKAIDRLAVRFNKPIQAETFTREDIILRIEGEQVDTDLPITKAEDSDSIFFLNTSALSDNGYYSLQVNTADIRDREGFLGYAGKQVRWMYFKDALVQYNVAPWPDPSAGSIASSTSSTSGKNPYGTYLTFTAQPGVGYAFSYWGKPVIGLDKNASGIRARRAPAQRVLTENQIEQISTEPTIEVEMNQTQDLLAVFKPLKYNVTVQCDAAAGTLNFGSGIYDYGTVVNLEAAANDGYRLLGFVINGEDIASEDGHCEYTVRGNDNIEVRFKDLSPQNIILQDTRDYVPEAIEVANVKLQRSFRKGTWNTICLPCDVEDPQGVFGSGTQVARLTGVEDEVMHFSRVNRMEANIPYLIKPGSLMNSTLVADGQTKTAVYDILLTSIQEPGAGGPVDDTHQGVQFIGSYSAALVPAGAGYYYISSDQLYYIDAAARVPSGRFRGYFHADGDNLVRQMGVAIGDETHVADVTVPQTDDIYSLDGVLRRKAGSGVRGLAPGLYIMGGKKVLVK
ncbi:MAG: Ig-like domain-containing protein [Bacteroidaceae bacterium]|nr:Ig-like domain-containing protein [Bacteroidaceae bacterium]